MTEGRVACSAGRTLAPSREGAEVRASERGGGAGRLARATGRLVRATTRRVRAALPPEPPYPDERRQPSLPPDASWQERYEAAVEAENRFLEQDPDRRWHLFRAWFPLAVVGVVLVGFLIDRLAG
jgi:hypothetical protein